MLSSGIRFLLKYNRALIAVVIVLTLGAGAWIPALTMGRQRSSWFSEDDPALAQYRSLKHRFKVDVGLIAAFVLEGELTPPKIEAVSKVAEEIRTYPFVSRVITVADGLDMRTLPSMSNEAVREEATTVGRKMPFGRYLINKEADTLGILIDVWIPEKDLVRDSEITSVLIDRIRALEVRYSKALGKPLIVGNTVVDKELDRSIAQDMSRMLPLSILIAVAVLFFFLRKIRRVVWPILAVGCALVSTLGIMAMCGSPFTVVSSSLFAVVMIIGVSDSIHIMERYMFLIKNEPKDAAFQTLKDELLPCFYTSATTALGFLSLMLTPVPMIRSLGFFEAVGILLAWVYIIIMSPAAFRPDEVANTVAAPIVNRWLSFVSRSVSKRPLPIIVGFAALTLGVSLWGSLNVGIDGRLLSYFRESSPIREDTGRLEQKLGGIEFGEIMIDGNPGMFLNEANIQKLKDASDAILDTPYIDHAVSGAALFALARENGGGSKTFATPYEVVAQDKMLGQNSFRYFFTRDFSSARINYAQSSLAPPGRRADRTELEEIVKQIFPTCEVRFSGYGTLAEEANQNVVGTLMTSLLGSILIFVIMLLVFGLKGGILSLASNIGAVALLPGFMGVLGYRFNIGTAIIAAVTIGIVVDDTIHLFCLYKDLIGKGVDRAEALDRTILEVGRPMMITALLFILGFNVFMASKLTILSDFGLLSSLIMSVALIYELFLSHALLKVFRPFRRKTGQAEE